MIGPATGVVRAVRTAVVTVVVVLLATVAHVLAGGHVPTGPAAVAAVVVVALLAHAATGRQLTTAWLLGLLGAGQLLLHRVFTAVDAAAPDAGALAARAGDGRAHGHAATHVAPAVVDPVDPVALAAGPAGGPVLDLGPCVLTPMLAAHVLATLLTALVLACGERALWRLWAWLAPLAVALLARCTVVAVRLPRAPRPTDGPRPVRAAVLARALPRRGPPVAAVPA